jgi:F-actin monooxygenase
LLKAALLLGVQVYFNVSFEKICEPSNTNNGWSIQTTSTSKEISNYLNKTKFTCIIGADGRRNTLPGFKRLEMRGRLALGITANFVNARTQLDAQLDEKGGVASVFAQKFFNDLYAETGVDLENIVYYKDDTHYFVMTAKKVNKIHFLFSNRFKNHRDHSPIKILII